MAEINQIYDLFINKVNFTNLSKNNMKYMTVCLCILFSLVFIGLLSHFLFFILMSITIFKSLLWLIECYNTNTNENNEVYQITVNCLEYFIVVVFLYTFSYPINYISSGFLALISFCVTSIIGVACILNKNNRQTFCHFFRNILADKNMRNENNDIVIYSKSHKIIKYICQSIDNFSENPLSIIESVMNINTEQSSPTIFSKQDKLQSNDIIEQDQ